MQLRSGPPVIDEEVTPMLVRRKKGKVITAAPQPKAAHTSAAAATNPVSPQQAPKPKVHKSLGQKIGVSSLT